MSDRPDVTIRQLALTDVAPVARLSGQLGYPATDREVRERLRAILRRPDHAVFVAEINESVVVGWVQVHHTQPIVEDRYARIVGLVVDERFRRHGIGRLLMSQSEQWASEHDCTAIYLNSNVLRLEPHPFSERDGYARLKQQFVYKKGLLPVQ